MKFSPEKLRIPDQRMKPFIDPEEIWELINNTKPDKARVREIISKSLDKQRLTLEETAVLINASDAGLVEEIKEGAKELKKRVYGNRIVLFAPLYVGNRCTNNCKYCGFRTSNAEAVRKTLDDNEIIKEVEALEDNGQKRLILVYGEHPKYSPEYIAHTVKLVYGVKKGAGEIRRVNINAAPLDIEGFRVVGAAGIGTYQVFQETYHRENYAKLHPSNTVKGNYRWRLYSMHRAYEAGLDDVGIGPLFGLSSWKFEVMAVLLHARELEAKFGAGPHTISFPRIEPADNAPGIEATKDRHLSDEQFKKVVLCIRLSVPYTGMILTARENQKIRDRIIPLGITQTDASSKIGLGAYSENFDYSHQEAVRQQFILGDTRSLDEVVRSLAKQGFITSFCTAGYRCGRTGQKILDALKSGHEGQFCKLNAIITYREWLDDFASAETVALAEPIIQKEIDEVKANNPKMFEALISYYEKTKDGARDLYF